VKKNNLDFKVVREEWNKYRLMNGDSVRIKASLSNLTVAEKETEKERELSFDFKNIFYKDPTSNDKGTPSADSKIAPNDVVESVKFEAVSEPMNIYDVPEQYIILIKSKVREIRKTKKFDSQGNRVYGYHVETAVNIVKYPVFKH